MSTNYKVVHAKDFIKSKHSGEIDLEESKKSLVLMAKIAEPPADFDVLVDTRGAQINLNITEMLELAYELTQYRESFRNKIAFLVDDDIELAKANLLEFYARDRGFKAKAFNDFEETIDWFYTPDGMEEDLWDKL
jgi:hypothetical protein